MTFDSKLFWTTNIEELKSKCQKSLNVFKMKAHTKWGGDRKCLQNLYIALTLLKMDHGSVIYRSTKSNVLHKLNSVQNTALSLISGAMYCSPNPSLYAETFILPFNFRRSLLSMKYYLKLSSNSTNPTHQKNFLTQFYLALRKKT